MYAFALHSEENIVFFYDAAGALLTSWNSGLPFSGGGGGRIKTLCATRGGTVWAVFTPNLTGGSTLYEIDPDTGTLIRSVAALAGRRLADDAQTRRQVAELADGNLLVVDDGEVRHFNVTTGEVSSLNEPGIDLNGGDDLADTSLDFDINAAGTFLVIVDSDRYNLLLIDLSDGTRTTIKNFGYQIAWPKWLADCSILVQTSGENAMQTYALKNQCYVDGVTPCPTSGTFTLTVGADTTTPLAWNCTGAELIAALEALASVGAGNVRFQTNSPQVDTDSIADVGYIQFEFCNALGFQPVAVTLDDSTDNGLALQEIVAGSQTVYDDDAGQYTTGDILRVTMDGDLIKTYRFDQTPYKEEGEGMYQFTANLAADRLWIHLEWDQGIEFFESSGLEILRLSDGSKVASIIPLIQTDEDVDDSAAAVAPGLSAYPDCPACAPITLCDSDVIPFDRRFRHKNAFYFHDFGETYPDEAAWRASFRSGDTEDGQFFYNEQAIPEVILDSTRKFNCRSTMRMPSCSSADAGGIGFTEFLLTTLDAPTKKRVWARAFIWIDENTPTDADCQVQGIADMTCQTNGQAITYYEVNHDLGGGVGVQAEAWNLDGPRDVPGGTVQQAFVAAPFAAIKGRWVPVVILVEADAIAPTRTIWFVDGVKIKETVGSIADPMFPYGVEAFFIDPFFLCDGSAEIGDFGYWIALFEFVDGGTTEAPINPYLGIDGFAPVVGDPCAAVPSNNPLAIDCTITGVMNEAQINSTVEIRTVTTRVAMAREIAQHRAHLLQRCITGWSDVEVQDAISNLAATVAVDLSEVKFVEARVTATQEWKRVPVVPLDDVGMYESAVVYIRNMNAHLVNYPGAWAAYDRIKLTGPKASVPDLDSVLTLSPNEQVAPLFCRALKLFAQGYLEKKAELYEAAAITRDEYREVVDTLMLQLHGERNAVGRRFNA